MLEESAKSEVRVFGNSFAATSLAVALAGVRIYCAEVAAPTQPPIGVGHVLRDFDCLGDVVLVAGNRVCANTASRAQRPLDRQCQQTYTVHQSPFRHRVDSLVVKPLLDKHDDVSDRQTTNKTD